MLTVSELARVGSQKAPIIEEEKCPPHKWRAQETKDQDGNVIKYSIVCEVCGPFKVTD